MSRDRITSILIAVLLLAAGVWLASATEWADVEVERPPRGEAAKNPLYATQSLLRKLGAEVTKRHHLAEMPPAQTRLVLASRHWNLFPDRAARLRAWVEQGGQLVIPGFMADYDQFKGWLPIIEESKQRSKRRVEPRPPGDRPSPTLPLTAHQQDPDCRELSERAAADSDPDSHALHICGPQHYRHYRPAAGAPALWLLEGSPSSEMIRLAIGKGTVTIIGPWQLMENRHALRADNALALVAALQVRTGARFWFVAEEAREPLLAWAWQRGWVSVLLALSALALFLWRNAPRFGPLAAPDSRHRRSMVEQVCGTAHFLQYHGSAALHGAQVRALHETAHRYFHDYAHMDGAQRVHAVAQSTGLDVSALARALRPGTRSSPMLSADLKVLENARRSLGRGPNPK